MAVKILSHKDPTKLEKLINKALAEGGLRLHSVSSGQGLFLAVLEPKPKSPAAAKPAAKERPAAKGKAKSAEKAEAKDKR